MKAWAKDGLQGFEESLVGLWSPLMVGAMASFVPDLCKNTSNNGLATANTDRNSTYIGSPFGTVMNLDGVDDGINIGSFAMGNLLNATSNTIAMWVYPKTTTNNIARYIGFGSAGATFSFRTNFQNLEFAYGGAAGVLSTAFTTAEYADKWTFILGTSTPTSAAIFINGRQVASRTDTVNMTLTTGGGIGYRFSVNSDYSPIQFAEAAVWGRSFYAPEVANYYAQGPSGSWQLDAPRNRSRFAQVTTFKNYWFRNQQRMIGGGIR